MKNRLFPVVLILVAALVGSAGAIWRLQGRREVDTSGLGSDTEKSPTSFLFPSEAMKERIGLPDWARQTTERLMRDPSSRNMKIGIVLIPADEPNAAPVSR